LKLILVPKIIIKKKSITQFAFCSCVKIFHIRLATRTVNSTQEAKAVGSTHNHTVHGQNPKPLL